MLSRAVGKRERLAISSMGCSLESDRVVSVRSETLLLVTKQSIHIEIRFDSGCKYFFQRFADMTGD